MMISALSCYTQAGAQVQVSEKDFTATQSTPLREKIFVHTDKDFYIAGEILWFKLYDVSADDLKPLSLNNVAYVEILNAQHKPVLQATVALDKGSGSGSFYLTSSLNSGNYIFRAYTNWMKNFSADQYFQKTITVINTLVPVVKTTSKDTAGYEIDFFPEGGNLVVNMESKLAFKVTDKYGNGINCNGTIVDESNRSVVSFASLKFGMGSFYFTPEKNHTYNAVVKIGDKTFIKELPTIYRKGYVMHASSTGENQITITVNSGENVQQPIYLLAYSNNDVKAALMQAADGNGKATFTLNKNNLPAGVTRLTVFNSNKQPMCERLIFTKPEALQLNLIADKGLYSTRSEVKMNLTPGSNNIADLSMSVFLLDSLQAPGDNNILNYYWLTSELKGKIESPQYYFSSSGHDADSALDNLLLTQGWSRFKPDNGVQNTQPLFHFIPEHEGHIIEGKVTEKNSGLPAGNIRVYLSVPGLNFRFASSVSNNNGKVLFDIKDFYGSGELVVQTAKADSMYRVEIADPFSNQTGSWEIAPLNFSEDRLQQLSRHNLAMQVQNAYTINQLNRFSAPLLDSNAFYGLPDKKYFLDDYVRFNTMEEVLREYISEISVKIRQGNYFFTTIDPRNLSVFENNPLVLIDGVPMFDMNKVIAYNPLKIQKAEVVTRKYHINSLTANGILSYSTYKGDLDGLQFDPGTIELSYDGLQLQREFYSPQYNGAEEKQSRLPDYRNVLYWSPQIITNGEAQIFFYTSDVKGKYVAVLQGIDANGKAGYTETEFEVK